MEAVPWVCEFCHGESGKPRASPGSRRCTSNKAPHKCREALAAARERERAELAAKKGARIKRVREVLEEQQHQPGLAALIASKDCLSIKEVLGVSFVNFEALSEGEQRGGVDSSDYCPEYLVRGGFGDAGDDRDALVPGTRWVALADLMLNCCSDELALLPAFEKQLATDMAAARRLIEQDVADRAAAQHEAEAASEGGG